MIGSVSSIIQACLEQLDHIINSRELEKYQSEVLPELWSDELGRLRVWTANIGAHGTGHLSLEYRLRDASHLRDQTLRVLGRLDRTIWDIQDALRGTDEPVDFSSDSDDSEDDQTDMQRIFHSLRDTINVLFHNSMSIRRPAHHDRLRGVKRSDIAAFEPHDRQHVAHRFPDSDVAVQQRLGLAISQRRAIQQSLGLAISKRRAILQSRYRLYLGPAEGLNKVLHEGEEMKSTALSETIATDLLQQDSSGILEPKSVSSQNTYAKTSLEDQDSVAVPPAPKEVSAGKPFECPYCFFLLKIDNDHSWAEHVFHDLMPYICVFPDCQTPHRLFDSRHEWYIHLQIEHSVPSDSHISIACPLCFLTVVSGDPLERHLGRHLEELALLALPQLDTDDNEKSLAATIFKQDTSQELLGSHKETNIEPSLYESTTDTHLLQDPASSMPSASRSKEPIIIRDPNSKSVRFEDRAHSSKGSRPGAKSKSRQAVSHNEDRRPEIFFENASDFHAAASVVPKSGKHMLGYHVHESPQRSPSPSVAPSVFSSDGQESHTTAETSSEYGGIKDAHVNSPGRSRRYHSYHNHHVPPVFNSADIQEHYFSSPYTNPSIHVTSESQPLSKYPERSHAEEQFWDSWRRSNSEYTAPRQAIDPEVFSLSHDDYPRESIGPPVPPLAPPILKPRGRVPQVHQDGRTERPEIRKAHTSAAAAPSQRLVSKGINRDVDSDYDRMDMADLRDSLPVVSERGTRRVSINTSPERTHSTQQDVRRSVSYADERRSAYIAVANSHRRKPTEYYEPSSTADDLNDLERGVESYQAAQSGRASTAALPLSQEILPLSKTSNRNGSDSGSGSGTASRTEEDKNMTLTLNGSKIRFTQESLAGKSINIRAGDSGGMRLNIGGARSHQGDGQMALSDEETLNSSQKHKHRRSR